MEESTQPQADVNRTAQVSPAQNQKKFNLKNLLTKKLLLAGVIIVAVVVLWIVFQANTQKEEVINPPPDDVIATVGDHVFFRSDAENLARQQYAQSAITESVIKDYTNILVEREILDLEAKKLGITVSEKEINDQIPFYATKGQKTVDQSLRDFIKYQIFKDKIEEKAVKNVQAYMIGFWIPPVGYRSEEPVEYTKMRAEAKNAFPQAEAQLKQGTSPFEAAKYIFNTYPALKDVLLLNNKLFVYNQDVSEYTNPATYVITKEDLQNSPELYGLLNSAQASQVRSIVNPDGSGAYVVKVISVNKDGYLSYADFLNAKKKGLVEIYN